MMGCDVIGYADGDTVAMISEVDVVGDDDDHDDDDHDDDVVGGGDVNGEYVAGIAVYDGAIVVG